jgi:hypothetical protein
LVLPEGHPVGHEPSSHRKLALQTQAPLHWVVPVPLQAWPTVEAQHAPL